MLGLQCVRHHVHKCVRNVFVFETRNQVLVDFARLELGLGWATGLGNWAGQLAWRQGLGTLEAAWAGLGGLRGRASKQAGGGLHMNLARNQNAIVGTHSL